MISQARRTGENKVPGGDGPTVSINTASIARPGGAVTKQGWPDKDEEGCRTGGGASADDNSGSPRKWVRMELEGAKGGSGVEVVAGSAGKACRRMMGRRE